MKINFSPVLRNFAGTELTSDGHPLTLGAACATVLGADIADEGAGPDQMVRRYKLGAKLYAGGEHDLRSEDVAMLKRLLAKGWPAVIAGQAIDMVEPTSE